MKIDLEKFKLELRKSQSHRRRKLSGYYNLWLDYDDVMKCIHESEVKNEISKGCD